MVLPIRPGTKKTMEKVPAGEYESIADSGLRDTRSSNFSLVSPVIRPPEQFLGPSHRPVYDFVAGVLSVLLATLLLVALAPVFLGIALLIKLDSPGPVFFGQLRAARYGRPFVMFKFRTMVEDAEVRLHEVLDQNEEASGKLLRIPKDHRITRVGQFLRKTSLDELPQLLNIIRGDMVFVGPRPPWYAEFLRYTPRESARLLITPGLTGLWQVSGRKDADFQTMVNLDLHYLLRRNLLFDLWIIIMTVPVIILGRGAR